MFDEKSILFQWAVLAWSWGDLGVVLGWYQGLHQGLYQHVLKHFGTCWSVKQKINQAHHQSNQRNKERIKKEKKPYIKNYATPYRPPPAAAMLLWSFITNSPRFLAIIRHHAIGFWRKLTESIRRSFLSLVLKVPERISTEISNNKKRERLTLWEGIDAWFGTMEWERYQGRWKWFQQALRSSLNPTGPRENAQNLFFRTRFVQRKANIYQHIDFSEGPY